MEARFDQFARLVLANRVVSGAVLLGLLAVAGVGALRLEVAFSFESFVGTRDDSMKVLKEQVERWGSDDASLFITVEHEDRLVDVGRLEALEGVLTRLEAHPNVDSAIGLPRIPLLDPGSAAIGATTTVLEEAKAAAARNETAAFQSQLLARDDIVPLLVSKDGSVTVLLTRLKLDADDITAFRPVVTSIRALLDVEEQTTGFRFAVAGIPAVRSEFVDLLVNDQAVFIGVALVLAVLLLIFLFRSVHGVVVPIITAAVPTGLLFGLMGWTDEPIGILTQVYVTLIPVIAVADTIHILTRYHQEVWARAPSGDIAGKAHADAIACAMRHTGAACLFTSVTTMVGFFSLFIADMEVLHTFGLFAGIGVGFAFLSLLVLLPIALSFVRSIGPSQVNDADAPMNWIDHGLTWTSGVAIARPVTTLIATVAVCGIALAYGMQVSVDNHLNDVLGEGHDVSRANHVVDDKLGGVVTIQMVLEGKPGALGKPEVLVQVAELEHFLRDLPRARVVRGPVSLLRTLHVAVVGTDEVPQSAALVAQLLLLSGGAANANDLLMEDLSVGRVILHIGDLGGAEMERLATVLEPKVASIFPASGEVTAKITGVNWIAYQGFNRLSRELLWSLFSALLFICVLIAFLFRSLQTALISMVPNMIPLLLTLAAMGFFGWPLDPPSSVVFVVALGIAVDDTIHLLARIQEERKRLEAANDPDALVNAVRVAVVRSGRAIAITTAILVVGFGVNSLSSFPMNRNFGALGGIAVFSALWCDLIVLPALLALVARVRRRFAPPPQRPGTIAAGGSQ